MEATQTNIDNSQMLYRTLGHTGVKISVLGLGGSHIGKAKLSDKLAIQIIRAALDAGMNFMDNSWDYNHGESERRLGKALKDGYRERAFVMTKIDGRSKKAAAKQFEESLIRLQLEQVDLLQLHEIIRFEDVDRIFGSEGALEALLEARRQGKLRYIGFTGHKDPHVHLYMLEQAQRHGFKFDAVQLPLNPLDAHFRSFERNVLPVLVQENIGVLGMKSLGGGVLLKTGAITAPECLRYAMSLPTSTVITGIDSVDILKQALDAIHNFTPMTEKEMESLRARTASVGQNGAYELFKTTAHFDSTTEHPEWMGEESQRTKALVGD